MTSIRIRQYSTIKYFNAFAIPDVLFGFWLHIKLKKKKKGKEIKVELVLNKYKTRTPVI